MHIALPKSRSVVGSGGKGPAAEQRLGFMAAGQVDELGYIGGYLLTTASARPLEFHYTTPVRPTATHRILYGAELERYIYGELIAANLARQTTLDPAFLITDQPLILSQRVGSSCPLICVGAAAPAPAGSDSPSRPKLTVAAGFETDLDTLNQWLTEANPGLDLSEPFVRVWQALRELTQYPSRAAA